MLPTRLLIIDDHDAVREALEARLRATAEVEIVGCTGCWRTGLRDAARLKPDVVLLEIKRSDLQGLDALRALTRECPHTSVAILTSYPDAEEQTEALRIGAACYLLKEIDTPQLVREIQAFARPQAVI
ncbi:MAG TPA: response regulator transcription factor [Thermoflexia bacterium]|nr:response regulator transcription factor [Thermoflexia bacterium]